MKIVIGLFTPDSGVAAVSSLTKNGFSYKDLSLMSSAGDIPIYLEQEIEGEPEEAAASGALVGGLAGGTVGLLGSWVASTIPGFETFSVTGLMTTAAGTAIGTFLGSLYSTRAETQTKIDLHEELEAEKMLLLVKTNESNVKQAVSLMEENNGQHIEVHALPAEEVRGEGK